MSSKEWTLQMAQRWSPEFNSHSGGEEMFCLLQSPNICFCAHKNVSLPLAMRQMNQYHCPTPCVFQINFNITQQITACQNGKWCFTFKTSDLISVCIYLLPHFVFSIKCRKRYLLWAKIIINGTRTETICLMTQLRLRLMTQYIDFPTINPLQSKLFCKFQFQ